MLASGMESFYGGDCMSVESGHASLACPRGLAVNVDSARTACRDAAAVLGSGERELVAEEPEERHGGVAVEGATGAVHEEGDHRHRAWWVGLYPEVVTKMGALGNANG